MNISEIKNIFSNFNKKNVIIIGDSMIDAYMWGKIEKMSPEAPVPVVEISKHEIRLGGAANVAKNIKSLGANVRLCSMIGNDINGEKLKELLKKEGIDTTSILSSLNRKTTVKTRIIAKEKHQLRVDEEDTFDIKEEQIFLNMIFDVISSKIDIILLQDYNKGILTKKIISEVIKIAKHKGISVIVDPKKENFLEYKGCDIFKPNLKELEQGIHKKVDADNLENIKEATAYLLQKLEAKSILLTLSSKGLCINSEKGFFYSPTHGGDVVDVSGAGDTVISIASLLYSFNVSYKDISIISSIAGGLVCQIVGVATINKEELLNEIIKKYKKNDI